MASDNDEEFERFKRRWDTEWGPDLPQRQRRLAGIFIIVAFVGIIALAFVAASQ